MSTRPDQASFYPDVLAEGSLAAALQAVAAAAGLSFPILGSESNELYHTAVASKVPHRNKLIVSA